MPNEPKAEGTQVREFSTFILRNIKTKRIVAEGLASSLGTVTVHWIGAIDSVQMFPSLKALRTILEIEKGIDLEVIQVHKVS